MKLKVEKFSGVFYLALIIILPLISFNRNPDLLHDTFFYSQAIAHDKGFQVHRDVYSPYGPIVPWLISICIRMFGEYVIIGRLLGLLICYFTCYILYKILSKRLSSNASLMITALFVSLSPERTELSSKRWIYGAGIWPTSLAILVTLLVFGIVSSIILNRNPDSRILFKAFSLSLLMPVLIFSRIQGLLVFIIFLIFTTYALLFRSDISRRIIFYSYLGILCSLGPICFYLYSQNSFVETFQQIIFSPFSSAGLVMQKRWTSWILAFMFLFTTSVLAMAALVSISAIIQKRYPKSFFIFASGFGALTFYFAGSFSFPTDLNKNLLLYQLKVISNLPSWWTFTLLLIFFGISSKILFKKLRILLKRPSKISLNSLEQLTYIALGMSSLTHLFWNYSYVYNVFPILIVVVTNLLGGKPSYALRIRSVYAVINVSLLIFLFATIIGLSKKYTTFDSPTLKFFVSTRSETINLDRLVSGFNKLEIKSSSQYLCEYTFFRSVDPESYKRDFIYFENPPHSKFDYLKSLESDVANVVICGESNFFKERDLEPLGWRIQNVWNFDDVPQVQVLVRNGGG